MATNFFDKDFYIQTNLKEYRLLPHLPASEVFSPLDRCANEKLSFDDVAVVAVCLFADLKLCEKAKDTCRKLKTVCGERFPQIRKKTCDTLESEVGFDGLYNKRVQEVIGNYGYTTFVDRWGAKCWIDHEGTHCGDDNGFYPWYVDEKTLREDLEEGKWREQKGQQRRVVRESFLKPL